MMTMGRIASLLCAAALLSGCVTTGYLDEAAKAHPEAAATLLTQFRYSAEHSPNAWFKGYIAKVNSHEKVYEVADFLKLSPGKYQISVACQPSAGRTFLETRWYAIEAGKRYEADCYCQQYPRTLWVTRTERDALAYGAPRSTPSCS